MGIRLIRGTAQHWGFSKIRYSLVEQFFDVISAAAVKSDLFAEAAVLQHKRDSMSDPLR